MLHTNEVKAIIAKVTSRAVDERKNAEYGGDRGDGGAHHTLDLLKHWVDGIEYASTSTTTVYASVVNKMRMEQDVEYAEYQRLKMKFDTTK